MKILKIIWYLTVLAIGVLTILTVLAMGCAIIYAFYLVFVDMFNSTTLKEVLKLTGLAALVLGFYVLATKSPHMISWACKKLKEK